MHLVFLFNIPCYLTLTQRLSIALDIANALENRSIQIDNQRFTSIIDATITAPSLPAAASSIIAAYILIIGLNRTKIGERS